MVIQTNAESIPNGPDTLRNGAVVFRTRNGYPYQRRVHFKLIRHSPLWGIGNLGTPASDPKKLWYPFIGSPGHRTQLYLHINSIVIPLRQNNWKSKK